ncbi:hypothetical protein RC74_03855 [Falsihalocynthiibacter arcticus]|uniref:Uncharacterized protein n=1 Tax=Falsihalocynthiibacter arcticus TaxID=1579316 RepID=A0A126UWR0_9RHOB|nr:hypothetical protein RC74_03855 [Falsihalocynthiibacter arcticus]
MTTRIIIHAGFYKTGATSLQAYSERISALFGDQIFYCSRDQLSDAAIAAPQKHSLNYSGCRRTVSVQNFHLHSSENTGNTLKTRDIS